MTRTEIFLAMLLVSMVTIVALAVPNRDSPGVPDLRGSCTWGQVDQRGSHLAITGRSWQGVGTIAEDGTVTFDWQCGERQAGAEYRIDGRTLRGAWWWADEATRTPETIEIRSER